MKNKKKGFTLVELLVVIAILAILATVSILGYTSFTKKATLSNDEAICAQINLILQANEQEGKPESLHAALEDVIAGGFDVTKLTPSTAGYHYLYNQDTNRFRVCTEADLEKSVNVKDWLFVDAKNADNRGYSVYLIGNENNVTTINVNGGIDTADVLGITTINYAHNGDAYDEVIINTYNIDTKITVDAALDTVYHRGVVGNVIISRTANGSYHELGTAGYVECASGRVVSEEGGVITTVVLTAPISENDIPACVQTNGGEIGEAYATTVQVATKNNNTENTDTLVIGTPGSADSDVLLTEEEAEDNTKVAEKVAEAKQTAQENAKNDLQATCEHNFVEYKCTICGFEDHFWTENKVENNNDFVDKGNKKYEINTLNGLIIFAQELKLDVTKFKEATITLKTDIDLAGCYWESMVASYITFDGDGHTISNLSATTINNGKNTGFFGVASCSTIKNLNFVNATVEGINHVAVIAGDGLCAKIENCSVKGATVTAIVYNNDDGDKAGAICGYLSGEPNAWVKNCTIEDVTINAYRDLGAAVGMANGSSEVSGNTIKNATINCNQENNYNNIKTNEGHNADNVVGRKSNNCTITNNTNTNVTVNYSGDAE